MGIADQLKQLQAGMAEGILEPDRPRALVEYVRQLGYQAEIEWVPEGLMDANAGGGTCIMGRIQLTNSPINWIEMRKYSSGSKGAHSNLKVRRTVQSVRYIDHFLIQAPGQNAGGDLRAAREPKKAFWIAGRVVGWPWRGGRLAQQLEEDAQLNQVLASAGQGRIHVRHDAKAGAIVMTRPYAALTAESLLGLRVADVAENVNVHVTLPTVLVNMMRNQGEVEKSFGFPSKTVLQCYERIAHHARRAAGLPGA